MSEKLSGNGGGETAGQSGSKNEWEKMAEDAPPFNAERKGGESAWARHAEEARKKDYSVYDSAEGYLDGYLEGNQSSYIGNLDRLSLVDGKLQNIGFQDELSYLDEDMRDELFDACRERVDRIREAPEKTTMKKNDELYSYWDTMIRGDMEVYRVAKDHGAEYAASHFEGSPLDYFAEQLNKDIGGKYYEEEEIDRKMAISKEFEKTLSELYSNLERYEDGSEQTLSSAADKRIAELSASYLGKMEHGRLADDFKQFYGVKMAALLYLKDCFNQYKRMENGEDEFSIISDGVELRNLDKMDISSERDKSYWLGEKLNNDLIKAEAELGDAKASGDEKAISDAESRIALARRQQNILRGISYDDKDGEDGFLGALWRRTESATKKKDEMWRSGDKQRWYDAQQDVRDSYGLFESMKSEAERRDPKYFSFSRINKALEADVKNATQNYWDAIGAAKRKDMDGYLTENGIEMAFQEDNKQLMENMAEARTDKEYAERDARVYELLIDEYGSTERQVPILKIADFIPVIDRFVEERTRQVNQLLAESKSLTEGTPEYEENKAKRFQFAQERSSAKRIKTRFFGDFKS